ncbi:MAG TPA: hypothetical protein VIY70_01400 [Acidimicrobiia bacterium]
MILVMTVHVAEPWTAWSVVAALALLGSVVAWAVRAFVRSRR